MPVIGAAYLRCSDPRQDKSIEQQREEISRRADVDGVTIPDDLWFIDEGISGRAAKKRTAYQALLRRAEAQHDAKRKRAVPFQRIDRLYVWAFSRVARNMTDCLRALASHARIGRINLRKDLSPASGSVSEITSTSASSRVASARRQSNMLRATRENAQT